MESKNHTYLLLVGLMMSFCIAVGWFVSASTAPDPLSGVIISIGAALSMYSIFIIIILAISSVIETVKKDRK